MVNKLRLLTFIKRPDNGRKLFTADENSLNVLGVQNSYVAVMLFAAIGAVDTTEYIRRFTSEATLDHIWFGQYVDKAKQWCIKIQSPVIRAANVETSCNEIDEEGEWCDELLNWQK